MKNFISLLSITFLSGCIIGCTNNPRDEHQYDTNAAEMAETPGDLQRGDAETNEQAAAKAPGHSVKTVHNAHPTQNDLREETKDKHKVEHKDAGTNDPFAMKAAEAGQTEVKLGELAIQRTSNNKVKEFAEMMVKDHSATNNELKALATKKNINLPECTSCETAYKNFGALDKDQFDAEYVKQMVADHEKAVALFTSESMDGTDADLKKFAAEKLPTLKHHLVMAKELAAAGSTTVSKKELRKEKRKQKKAAKG